ncbi:glycosyl transferase family 2 [Desulfovibrio sp. X2]|uniref:glycosyltransferase family 2 protein n=1 Tax=Desulfovibrio sp. X2 TaxID=941449 RepID=UPI000358D44E|nr:glycosyltransferase family 2 protein [Desulfovibrio sp. X2]EPR39857.1 glycosyl transferase family 2 [Desulfovibrio sp. X2]
MQSNSSLSVVIPVFNEEDNLRPLMDQIRSALAPLGRPWEAVFVDDCSTDRSLAVIRELAAADPEHVRYAAFAANRGQSAAFAAGFAAARHDLVVTIDADLQNDPADIPLLLELIDQGYDMACGLRARRRDSFMKRIASKIGNFVRTRMTGKTVTDTGCSLKIMRADMARRMPVFKGMHRFLPNLMLWQGARVAERPVNHRPRVAGKSKYGTLDRAISGGYDLLGVRWLRARYIQYEIKEKN